MVSDALIFHINRLDLLSFLRILKIDIILASWTLHKWWKYWYEKVRSILLFLSSSYRLVTMKSWVQVLETASCRNTRKGCVHKTQSGWTLFQTLHKAGATCTGLPFLMPHTEGAIPVCLFFAWVSFLFPLPLNRILIYYLLELFTKD
jgi:hypothetical protein